MSDHRGPAGERLHASLSVDGDPAWLDLMIAEACRMADRLEKFDRLLRGDIHTWLYLDLDTIDSGRVAIVLNNAVGEARQLAGVFARLIGEIRKARAEVDAANPVTVGDEFDAV